MARKRKPIVRNQVPALSFGPALKAACQTLRSACTTTSDRQFVRGCQTFGKAKGILTMGQLRVLGAMYKRLVNNGKFVSYDWWK